MKNSILKLGSMALVAVIALANNNVFAGAKGGNTVHIDTMSHYAYGTIGVVYGSADSTQFIGCMLSTDGTKFHTQCDARDSIGNEVTCVSDNEYIFKTAASINSLSDIKFYWAVDGTMSCTQLEVKNYSWGLPPK